MASVFDLLDDIQARPGMFLGWTANQRKEQLRHLETLLMGYGHAVAMHDLNDPGRDFLERFGAFLKSRHGWSDARGPIAAIVDRTGTHEEAWQLLWKLIREFRDSTQSSLLS
jgi:hypothetical protein